MEMLKKLASEKRIEVRVDIRPQSATFGDGAWNSVFCCLSLDGEEFEVEGNVEFVDRGEIR